MVSDFASYSADFPSSLLPLPLCFLHWLDKIISFSSQNFVRLFSFISLLSSCVFFLFHVFSFIYDYYVVKANSPALWVMPLESHNILDA